MTWWHDAAIYQIYPRSFRDSSGDGVGDLNGITERLGYIRDLGVGAVWLSPIFESPMRDFGYDVADYCAIDPLFGNLDDFDRFLTEAHSLGLKVLLDFVPNHTSDQHQWFVESRQGRQSAKRDWYIWRDPRPDGSPPNNWISNFGGPAWTFDEASGQYFYHAFLSSQPDLNWRNPEVRAAMFDTLRFWLERGVDGFRVDVIWHLIKDAEFKDNPPNPAYEPGKPEIGSLLQIHSNDQPEVHEVIEQMRRVVDEYPERLLIGEIYLPVERLMRYYGLAGEGVHLPFNFQLISAPWRARTLAALIHDYERALPEGGWPNWVLSNHDQPRIAARVGEAQARVAAVLLLTLRGTPTVYYGDEIGIGRVDIPLDRIQDPWAKQEPEASFNRDAARTPMQWDDTTHGGFSEVTPWLPMTADAQLRHVAAQTQAPDSLLNLYRQLLALRQREPALRTGEYHGLLVTDQVLGYERKLGERRLAILLNFTDEEASLEWPEAYRHGHVLLSTLHSLPPPGARLRAHEAIIVESGVGDAG